jgi:probable rRNA maturation factor
MSVARHAIAVVVEERAWRTSGVDFARLRLAARLALSHGPPGDSVRTPPPSRDAALARHLPPGPAAGRPEDKLRGGGGLRCELTLLLANDERLKALNAGFRGKAAPTNVLAFPAAQPDSGYLGDVAIALGTAGREAQAAGIGLMAHTLHLTVHGVLHLLGYDHMAARESRIMERLEIDVLNELGVPNPYARATAG